MADRVSQLQDAVNQQAENLCNATGILCQSASPAPFPGGERGAKGAPPPDSGYDQRRMFAALIARNAQDIDTLIDSLPSDESCAQQQLSIMRDLDAEGEAAANRLGADVARAEVLQEDIARAMRDIARASLSINRITHAAQAKDVRL